MLLEHDLFLERPFGGKLYPSASESTLPLADRDHLSYAASMAKSATLSVLVWKRGNGGRWPGLGNVHVRYDALKHALHSLYFSALVDIMPHIEAVAVS
jgi:hypothetical protein